MLYVFPKFYHKRDKVTIILKIKGVHLCEDMKHIGTVLPA